MIIEAGFKINKNDADPIIIECQDSELIFLEPMTGGRSDRIAIGYDPRTGIWSIRGDRIILSQGTAANTIEFKFTDRGLRGLSS